MGAILLARTLTPQKEKDHPKERETERERTGGGPKRVFTCTELYPPQYLPVGQVRSGQVRSPSAQKRPKGEGIWRHIAAGKNATCGGLYIRL